MNRHDDLANTNRHVETACAIALLVLVLFGDAIIEWLDPGRIDRRIAHVEQIDLPPAPVASTWSDEPNTSRCGWSCINRIPTAGETWPATATISGTAPGVME